MADAVVARPGFRDVYIRFKDRGDGTTAEVITFGEDVVAIEKDGVGDVLYIGRAAPGTLPSAAAWQIRKAVVVGAATLYRYADGDTLRNNVWDDRAGLTYS